MQICFITALGNRIHSFVTNPIGHYNYAFFIFNIRIRLAETITPKVISSLYPDGFFATNDDTALGILYSVKRMGMRVPEDISICGFTNGTRAISCEPQLTTVEQRGLRVGEEAAKALIDQLEGRIPPGKYRNQIIKTKLIVRGTTRPVSPDIQKD